MPIPFACSTAAFRTPLGPALETIAGLGFQNVDLIAIGGWDHVNVDALIDQWETETARIESLLQTWNLKPIAMNCASPPHAHQRGDEAQNERRRLGFDALARLAVRLGVRTAGFYPGYKCPDRDRAGVLADSVATYREMLDAAKKHGVEFVVEPHFDTPFENLEQTRELFEALPELRITYDPTHFLHRGITLKQTEPLIARASHVHLRDVTTSRIHAPYPTGLLDPDWIVSALKAHGYRGAVSIECLPFDPIEVTSDIRRLQEKIGPLLAS